MPRFIQALTRSEAGLLYRLRGSTHLLGISLHEAIERPQPDMAEVAHLNAKINANNATRDRLEHNIRVRLGLRQQTPLVLGVAEAYHV